MTKGLRGALLAPLVAALLLLGAPTAALAAPPKAGDPPAAGSDRQPRGAHSGHPDNPDPKAGDAPKDPKAGDKDPKAGDQPKDPKAGDNKDPKNDHDSHAGDQHDGW